MKQIFVLLVLSIFACKDPSFESKKPSLAIPSNPSSQISDSIQKIGAIPQNSVDLNYPVSDLSDSNPNFLMPNASLFADTSDTLPMVPPSNSLIPVILISQSTTRIHSLDESNDGLGGVDHCQEYHWHFVSLATYQNAWVHGSFPKSS